MDKNLQTFVRAWVSVIDSDLDLMTVLNFSFSEMVEAMDAPPEQPVETHEAASQESIDNMVVECRRLKEALRPLALSWDTSSVPTPEEAKAAYELLKELES